jgi:ABC-type phosphate transport system substrate-binding protein
MRPAYENSAMQHRCRMLRPPKTKGSMQMNKRESLLLMSAAAVSLSLLSACATEQQPQVPTTPRRAEMGAPLQPAGAGAVATDSAVDATSREWRGAPLTPGRTESVTTGGTIDVSSRERRGAPLPPSGVGSLGTSGANTAR